MDNRTAALFIKRGILLKDLQTIDSQKYTKKRSLQIFSGVGDGDFYTIVFVREAKSPLLLKEFEAIDKIASDIAKNQGHAIKKRILFYSSQICTKVVKNKSQWALYDFV